MWHLAPGGDVLARRVQKPYSAVFEVGIVGLSRILGLKCGYRMPGRSGVFGNIDLAREMVDWISTLRWCEDTSKRIE